ncbi:peptidase inhibitor family I36 protein [Streptomyces sp. NPDC059008]|uniref:peptidase inhibitor family I36 protein n=1 Tax=unclassified Streptomyces TaxID=2593676 RepID=UPI0036B9DE13
MTLDMEGGEHVKIRIAVAAGAAALATLFAGSASAAPAQPRDWGIDYGSGTWACRTGYVCLYDNWDFNGGGPARILMTNEDMPRLDQRNFNDVTSSIVNNTNRVVRVYPNYDYSGVPATLFPGERISLNNDNGNFNDIASSVKILPIAIEQRGPA